MTRYFVNNREITAPPAIASFSQLLKIVETNELSSGSFIKEVQIDGHIYGPEVSDREGWGLTWNPEWERIEFFTATMTDVAQEAISGALDYLTKIEQATPGLITRFQDTPQPDDFINLRGLCEGFVFLFTLLGRLTVGYGLNLDTVRVRDTSVREQLMKFSAVVGQLNEAQESRDYLLIADTLEYEVLPVVSVWKDIFMTLLDKINQKQ